MANKEINRNKWDQCVKNSPTALIYGLCDFLDQVNPDWEGLVIDDYKAVFPLPRKCKWYVKYLAQPFYTQQLGLFGSTDVLLQEILNVISRKFKFIDIKLNYGNVSTNVPKGHWYTMDNYTLNLSKSYDALTNGYSQSHAKNLRRARKENLTIVQNSDRNGFVDFYAANEPKGFKYSAEHIGTINRLASNLNTSVWWVYNEAHKPLASALVIKEPIKRFTYHSASSNEGRSKKALFLLIDNIIETHAGSNNILDFAGSSINSIAKFFEGFGASKEIYPCVKLNKLPWPLNLIKK